jgi:hypothetical protein
MPSDEVGSLQEYVVDRIIKETEKFQNVEAYSEGAFIEKVADLVKYYNGELNKPKTQRMKRSERP